MKKILSRASTIFLVLVIVLTAFPITSFAATTTKKYETIKDNVPVWSEASSKSTKVYRIEDEGTIVEVTSSKTNSAGNLWYKLTDGNWVFSGNVKKHSHKSIMCGYPPTYSYAQKNSSSHTVTEKLSELCSCGRIMGYQILTCDEPHRFNSNNTCTKCGYTKPHNHKAVACGKATNTYAQKNASVHTVTTKMPDLCSCGHVMGYQTIAGDEVHSFNSNNTCTKCSYKKVHTHKAVSCGMATYSYSQKNSSAHTVTTKMPDLCSCGHVMGYQTITGDEAHSFNSNNTCTKCGYKKVHTHKAVSCGKATYSYSQKNSSAHTVTTKMPDLCSCGHVMGYQTTTGDEAHSFNSNNTCTKCGYKKVHSHKLDHLERVNVKYFTQDAKTHIFEEELFEICSCGSTINKKCIQTTKQHEFNSNGKCVCGYTKDTPTHKHIGITCGTPFQSYSVKDRNVHYVLEKTPNLCECGTIVNFDTLILKEEAHHFNDDICKECNVEKSYGILDVEASQIVEQAVKGNYSDDVTLAGIVGEILIGEIPLVGTIADVRDVVSDIQNDAGFVTTTIDAVALIPVVGGVIKYADEAVDASQGAKKIVKTEFFANGTKQAKKYSEGVDFTIGPGGKEYPRFEKWSIAEAKFKKPTLKAAKNHTGLSGNYYWDSKLANELNGFSKTPSGYVWHHVEDMQTMILVPQDLHSSYFGGMSHVGGASIIKEYLNLK